jgi:hypothetical protein
MKYVKQQIEVEILEYKDTKELACENLDEDYVKAIEQDDIFMNGQGEDFEAKYIHSRFRVIRTWAESKKRLMRLLSEYKDIMHTIQQLEQNMFKVHVELYQRFIGLQDNFRNAKYLLEMTRNNLKISIDNLQMAKDELKMSRYELEMTTNELKMTTDGLKMARDELKMTRDELEYTKEHLRTVIKQQQREHDRQCLTFSIFDKDMYGNGGTVKHCGMGNQVRKAIGGREFPNNRISAFFIHVDIIQDGWMACGIISNIKTKSSCFTDSTFFGWCQNTRECIPQDDGAWPGWRRGDEAVIIFNPMDHSLQIFHRTLNRMFGIFDLPNKPFHLCVDLFTPNSCVQVRVAKKRDMKPI